MPIWILHSLSDVHMEKQTSVAIVKYASECPLHPTDTKLHGWNADTETSVEL